MKVLLALCLISITLLSACTQSTSPGMPQQFAIYALRDSTQSAAAVWDKPLEGLDLASTPFLTEGDLKSYTWNTHEYTVNAVVDSQLAALTDVHGSTGGIPFVVVVGSERVYLGAFWYAYSSLVSQVPFIDVLLHPHRIQNTPSPLVTVDRRADRRIYQALKSAGVLIE